LFLGDAVDCKANKYQLARLQFGLERYREWWPKPRHGEQSFKWRDWKTRIRCCNSPPLGAPRHQGQPPETHPPSQEDLRTLIDMGYVEMRDDRPFVTSAGVNEMDQGDW